MKEMKTLLWLAIGIAVSGLALAVSLKIAIMRTTQQFEFGLVSPCPVLALLWIVFFVRYKRESRRLSAWIALLFTSLSALALIWALMISDRANSYENHASQLAGLGSAIGWLAALVWFARSRNVPAVTTILTAVWLTFILSITF